MLEVLYCLAYTAGNDTELCQNVSPQKLILHFFPSNICFSNLLCSEVFLVKIFAFLVERYEVTSQNVILYMNRIDSNPISFAFLMEQSVKADNYQPAKINIYDYYEPSVSDSLNRSMRLSRFVC